MPASWTIRPGELVDVPAVARLVSEETTLVDIDGDGIVDGPADPETAQAVFRMVLGHVVLDQGRLWLAEREGAIVGAAVWSPTSSAHLAGDVRAIVTRELDPSRLSALGPTEGVRGHLERALPDLLALIMDVAPRLVLLTVAYDVGADASAPAELVTDLLRPVLDEDEAGDLVAVTLAEDQIGPLERAGFERLGSVTVGTQQIWVGRAR